MHDPAIHVLRVGQVLLAGLSVFFQNVSLTTYVAWFGVSLTKFILRYETNEISQTLAKGTSRQNFSLHEKTSKFVIVYRSCKCLEPNNMTVHLCVTLFSQACTRQARRFVYKILCVNIFVFNLVDHTHTDYNLNTLHNKLTQY